MNGSDSKEAPIQELDELGETGSGDRTTDNILARLADNPSNYSLRTRLLRHSADIWDKEQQENVGRIRRRWSDGACEVKDYEQKRAVGEIYFSGGIFIDGKYKGSDRKLGRLVFEKVVGPVEKYLSSLLSPLRFLYML
tara:strand:+ start:40 stop:453 length:414 start_codon:yes stop_codon:yes gene_type:complete